MSTGAPPASLTASPVALRFATAAMGTRFELLLHADAATREDAASPHRVRAIGEAALEEIERWHRRLTRFAPDSLISHINRTAATSPVRLDAETFALFADALAVHRASGGAFDITAASRETARTAAAAGSGAALHAASAPRLASDAIELDARARTIRMRTPGVALDLGGIAKGHALDHAAALLRGHGIENALLHGGTSSIVALGAPPGEDGWRVAIGRGDDAPIVSLRDATLSVSSTAGRTGGDSVVAQAHILDPHTGAAIAAPVLAAVIGPSARLGDAWATALAVLAARPAALDGTWTTMIRGPHAAPQWAGPCAPRRSAA